MEIFLAALHQDGHSVVNQIIGMDYASLVFDRNSRRYRPQATWRIHFEQNTTQCFVFRPSLADLEASVAPNTIEIDFQGYSNYTNKRGENVSVLYFSRISCFNADEQGVQAWRRLTSWVRRTFTKWKNLDYGDKSVWAGTEAAEWAKLPLHYFYTDYRRSPCSGIRIMPTGPTVNALGFSTGPLIVERQQSC